MKLTWYFDLVSPFAHLALPRVLRMGEVELKPIVFGAVLSHWGQLGPAEIEPKRLQTYRQTQFEAERAGIPMRYPPRHPFRSLDALRLLTALRGDRDAVRAAFAFVWSEGRDPHEDFAALRERLSPVSDEALESAKAELRAATESAIAAGIFGVPTLAVGGELFWGADAMPMAEAFLADPTLFTRGEMARLATLPTGIERRRG
ncbi:2-hydroxychromene-2-carboxylate isomerase [Sediminicoccus sp. BL-A-41-H5]|uniref:2-hydroxychromene-2-carboxylate isomerase n=1 Tax=Sediminicoccus sp. BL-A-41-H5 TaxID=3421106 RepID=UPI003D67AC7F